MPIAGATQATSTHQAVVPWHLLAQHYGMTDQEAYAYWHQASLQTKSTKNTDIGSIAVQIIESDRGTGTPPGDAPPGGGTTGTGGGSTAASSAAARAKAIAGAEASYSTMLRQWGMELTPKLQNLISNAARSGWNSSQFTTAVRGTEEYKQQFPGIQWKRGMSEATYNSQYDAYLEKGQDAGYRLSREGFAHLMKKGVDSSEWALRVSALKQIKANQPLLLQFQEELRARGVLKPNEKMNPVDLRKFVTGRGSSSWTSVWNMASVSTGLEGIGIDVGRGGDISRKDLQQLLSTPESKLQPGQVVDIDFAALAATASRALPASRLYKLGITKKDLVTMALGGKNAASIADRVNLAIGTAEATATEQRANPQLTRQGMELGSPKTQATE